MDRFNAAYRVFAPVTWSLNGEYYGCMDATAPDNRGDGTAHTSRYLHGFNDFGGHKQGMRYPGTGTGSGMWMFGQSWDMAYDGQGDAPIFFNQSRTT